MVSPTEPMAEPWAGKTLAAVKQRQTKANITKAYSDFLAKEPGAEDNLLKAIFDFAKGKLTSKLYRLNESAQTPEDYAQDISIKVWSQIHTVHGDFYAWLNRICFTEGADAFTETKEVQDNTLPLLVESEEGFMEDHPVFRRDQNIQYVRAIPEFITGIDRMICDYIREGLTYRQMGLALELTEAAVKLRVAAMRNKVMADAENKKAMSN